MTARHGRQKMTSIGYSHIYRYIYFIYYLVTYKPKKNILKPVLAKIFKDFIKVSFPFLMHK